MTFADYPEIANQAQFYAQLDSFGISLFFNYVPDSAGKYLTDSARAHIRLSTTFLHDPLMIGLDPVFDLQLDGLESQKMGLSSLNDKDIEGYVSPSNQRVGVQANDPVLLRDVWGARTIDYSPGLLHTSFSKGVFHNPGRNYDRGENARFDARLRIGTKTTHDSTVIARLIVEWEWFVLPTSTGYGCLEIDNPPNKRNVQRLNDTLLIIETASGLDTVPALPDSVSTYYNAGCRGTDTYTAYGTDRPTYISYINPVNSSDTVRALPFRCIKEIHTGDFVSTSQWKTFSMNFSARHYEPTAYKIEWLDKEDLYLDSMFVSNERGRRFFSLVDDSLTTAVNRYNSYLDEGVSGQRRRGTDGITVFDEPTGAEYPAIKKLQNVLDQLGDNGLEQPVILKADQGDNPDARGGKYIDSYAFYSGKKDIMFDYYPNSCCLSPSSSTSNPHNFQAMVDGINDQFCHGQYLQLLQRARNRIVANNDSLRLWVILPSSATYKPVPGTTNQWRKEQRLLHPSEYRAMINLALCYGAKGIGYWPYIGRRGACYTDPNTGFCGPTRNPDLTPRNESNQAVNGGSPSPALTCSDIVTANCNACSLLVAPYPPYSMYGFAAIEPNNNVITTPLWDSMRVIHQYLDSMAWFFNNATQKSTGRWAEALSALSGSFVDSVKSLRFTSPNAFLHVAFYEYNSEQYAYIVNRRVDNNYEGLVDSQRVRVFFKQPWIAASEITNLYTGLKDTIYDSLGVRHSWDYTLEPGGAVLIKRRVLKESWAGNLTGNWTWPRFSTIRIPGDLTVATGSTVTMNSPNLIIAKNADSLHTGLDANRTEIIVSGTLRLEGTSSSNRTTVTTTGSGTFPTWYGIRTSGNGRIVAKHAYVSNAVVGMLLGTSGTDSVLYSHLDSCQLYGISKSSGTLICVADTFRFTGLSTLPVWQAIRTSGVGRLTITNSLVSNANIGFNLNGSRSDTISYTRIDSCRFNGIRKVAGSLYCYADTFRFANSVIADSAVALLTTLSTGKNRTIRNCLIDGYWTGIAVSNAPYGTVVIDSTAFRWSPSSNTGSVGVKCGILANPFIKDCEFDRYWHGYWGSPQGYQSRIERCRFYSDTQTWNKMMHVGVLTADTCVGGSCPIDGTSGATTTVRQCCFRLIKWKGVWMQRSGLDLGINLPSDSGKNVFNHNTYTEPGPKVFQLPNHAIYNSTGLTMSARGNYWSAYAPANWIFGSVDTSGGRTTYAEICNDPIGDPGGGGNSKIADTTVADDSTQFAKLSFDQNYPNPFNPETSISFTLAKESEVRVTILNILGQEVKTLSNQVLSAGKHSLLWDGRDASGKPAATGIYFSRVETVDSTDTKKLLLMK